MTPALRAGATALVVLLAAGLPGTQPAAAQGLDLSHGGPIAITAANGIEWRQAQHEIIAQGDAKAVRGGVTVTADRLIAWYRKKNGPPGHAVAAGPATAAPAGQAAAGPADANAGQYALTGDGDTGGNEVYRVQAQGNVHIYSNTDQLWGDVATFDLDQAVVVVTGHDLRLQTPDNVLTARQDLEYWTQKHMAVARGDAVVVNKEGRRLQADTLVAFTAASSAPAKPAPAAAPGATAAPGAAAGGQGALLGDGKLRKVEAYGHVVVRTALDTVTGDRAVYVPATGVARVIGNVHITRGPNQLAGAQAVVDLKTGVSRLLAGNTGRVQGLLVPNQQTNQELAPSGQAGTAATGSSH